MVQWVFCPRWFRDFGGEGELRIVFHERAPHHVTLREPTPHHVTLSERSESKGLPLEVETAAVA
jgi:hypothetical protein